MGWRSRLPWRDVCSLAQAQNGMDEIGAVRDADFRQDMNLIAECGIIDAEPLVFGNRLGQVMSSFAVPTYISGQGGVRKTCLL